MKHIFKDLIPPPVSVVSIDGRLSLITLQTIRFLPELHQQGERLIRAFQYFGNSLEHIKTEQADITLNIDNTLSEEAWKIKITPEKVQIIGGDHAGLFYAITAMKQILVLGYAKGCEDAFIDCGVAEDKPRFSWRGLMLDSVRHFQSKEKIKEVIHLIANWRLNVFHWHLSDSQGVRIPFSCIPSLCDQFYTKEDIKEIVAFATDHCVRIIPELDIPGHSNWLLQQFPEYACNSDQPRAEFCLGNLKGRKFLKSLISELIDIFPDSHIIHLGGDEADVKNWEKCPKCQAMLQKSGLSQMRNLENQFMNEMTRHVIAQNRCPMVWCTDSVYPADTIVQAWQSLLEIHRTYPQGNNIINSIHYCCYLDYPSDSTEPREPWMHVLSEECVYQSFEPHKETLGLLRGTEACLWTEVVPEWRVIPKIDPRLAAFAENAWIQPQNKDWQDFQRRKKQLEAVGYKKIIH